MVNKKTGRVMNKCDDVDHFVLIIAHFQELAPEDRREKKMRRREEKRRKKEMEEKRDIEVSQSTTILMCEET